MWISQEYKDDTARKTLPDFIDAAGYFAVSTKLADVLRRFDLGPSRLTPVRLLHSDRTTPFPGDHFLFQIKGRKRGFEPNHAPRLRPRRYKRNDWIGWLMFDSQDGDIAVNTSVRGGSDVWTDPDLALALFFSERLGTAIRDGGFLSLYGMYPCPILKAN